MVDFDDQGLYHLVWPWRIFRNFFLDFGQKGGKPKFCCIYGDAPKKNFFQIFFFYCLVGGTCVTGLTNVAPVTR